MKLNVYKILSVALIFIIILMVFVDVDVTKEVAYKYYYGETIENEYVELVFDLQIKD